MTPLPKTPGEFLSRPDALPLVLDRLRALQNLRLDVTVNGATTPIALRAAGGRALLAGELTIPVREPEEAEAAPLDPETIVWRDAITAAGGTFESDSIDLADALIKAIKATSYGAKIKYLLPLLGGDLTAARMPLRDTLGAGMATSVGYVDADFSQSTGIQANGSSKYFDTKIKPSQVGSSGNGGIGYWERATANGDIFMGVRNSSGGFNIFELFFRKSAAFGGEHQLFRWGDVANFAGSASGFSAGHYYGQRSAATLRELFRDGSSLFTNTTSDPAAGASTYNMFVCGAVNNDGSPLYGIGRCGVVYFTDGILTAAEVSQFHTLLQTYLITPTGR